MLTFVTNTLDTLGRRLTSILHEELHQKNVETEQPTYDILNVQGGNRFVVLSNQGGMVAHNCVQRTGHDVHVIFLYILSQELKRQGIEAHGVVWDFHDQYIIQIDARDAEKALKVHTECVDKLNDVLGATVRLKYGPRIVHSMSEAKMEEDFDKRKKSQGTSLA